MRCCAPGHNKVVPLQDRAQPWAAIAANLQMLLMMGAEVGPRKRTLASKYAVRRHARAASQLHSTPCFLPRAMP